MRQIGVVRRRGEITAVIAGIGHVESVFAGIGGIAECLAIAEQEALEAELGLFGAEAEKGVAEEIAVEIDGVARASARELVGDLRGLAAQIEGSHGGLVGVAERGRDETVLRGRGRRGDYQHVDRDPAVQSLQLAIDGLKHVATHVEMEVRAEIRAVDRVVDAVLVLLV